jgi:hypothetical protein
MQLLFRDAHGEVHITSTSGVSQGCPLSSALFQLTMSHILMPVRAEFNALIPSYQDDNVLEADNLAKLDRMFARLKALSLFYNLLFNFSKMWLLSNRPFPANFDTLYPTLALMRRTNRGIKILGGYVGDSNFIHDQLTSALDKTFEFFTRVRELIAYAKAHYPHVQYTQLLLSFLRYCCPSKASYLLRVTHTHHMQPFLLPLDKGVASLVLLLIDKSDLFRTPPEFALLRDFIASDAPNDLNSEASVIFSRIFTRLAGLGFSSTVSSGVPAFLASVAAAAPFVQRDLNRTSTLPRDGSVILNLLPLEQAFAHMVLPQHRAQFAAFLPTFQTAFSRLDAQQHLSAFARPSFDANIANAMRFLSSAGRLACNTRYQKYLSQRHPDASRWIAAHRSNHHFQLNNEQCSDAITTQLGIQPFLPPICCYCSLPIPAESIEDHAFSSCGKPAQSVSGKITEKALRDAAMLVGIDVSQPQARLANMPGWCPTQFNLNQTPYKDRKADWVFTTANRGFVVDVCYTGQYSTVRAHVSTPGFAAAARAKQKFDKYDRLFTYPTDAFLPLALEAHGALDTRVTDILYAAHNGPHEANYNHSSLHLGLMHISVALRKTCTLHFNCIRYHTRTSPGDPSSDA